MEEISKDFNNLNLSNQGNLFIILFLYSIYILNYFL